MNKLIQKKWLTILFLVLVLLTFNKSSSNKVLADLEAPVLISPTDGISINDMSPLFNWTDVDGADTYYFQLNDNSNSTVAALYIATSEYDYYEDLEDGEWTWFVRANDSSGVWGAWSEIGSFTVDTVAPAEAPVLLTPANETLSNNMVPILSWDEVVGAFEYYLQFQTAEPDWGIGITRTETFWQQSFYLDDDHYRWRVRAQDEAGNAGLYSEFWYYTLDTTDPLIIGDDDVEMDLGETGLTISWTLSDLHPKNYTVYLDGAEFLFNSNWKDTPVAMFSLNGLINGVHEFKIIVTDKAGNVAEDIIIVSVYPLIPEYGEMLFMILLPILSIGLVIVIKKMKY